MAMLAKRVYQISGLNLQAGNVAASTPRFRASDPVSGSPVSQYCENLPLRVALYIQCQRIAHDLFFASIS